MPNPKALGNLDVPSPNSTLAGDAVFLSGWAVSKSVTVTAVTALVDGQPSTLGYANIGRPDVGLALPDVANAASSGFIIEADVSAFPAGQHEVAVRIMLADGTWEDMGQRNIVLTRPMHTQRRQALRPLLACIYCHTRLRDEPDALVCESCGLRAPLIGDVPVFQGGAIGPPPGPVSSSTYGPHARALIQEYTGGLILDCGAGYPTDGFANVVQFDLFRFPSTDATGDVLWLPFSDNTFDAVISQAVMEHVRDPFRYSSEILRVLKPGGKVIVDSAFMQPMHAYPYHYFNTTITGLHEAMKGFELIDEGVEIHQKPWVALNWLLSHYVAGLSSERDRKKMLNMRVREIIKQLGRGDASPPFDALTPEAVQELAAGVYFLGRKPKS